MSGSDSSSRSKVADYADGTPPDELRNTVTTDAEKLWKENEQLFVWLVFRIKTNWLVRTVPGGGKSYVKETVVPQLAHDTGRTFVLATTEYRNRQETHREVLATLIDKNLVDDVEVVYIPSPREGYGNIPQLKRDDAGEWTVTTPTDDEAVCQTFTKGENGEYVHGPAQDIQQYVRRGATTGAIHNAASWEWEQIMDFKSDDRLHPLRCQQEGQKRGFDPTDPESEPACRYRRQIQRRMELIKNDEADIIICGASLLNMLDVVQDATVIADEDVSGELVETYPEDYLAAAAENFLSSIDVGPNGYKGALRASDDVKAETAAHIRENHAPRSELDDDDDRVPIVNRNAPLKAKSYDYRRAEAPLLTLALLEGVDTEHTAHLVFDPDDLPYTVAVDLKRNHANNSHDMVAVATPPQPLRDAEQVIALDATGSEVRWELLGGVEFESTSPNPLEERGTVVTEAFDIEFRQLTKDMVPINRPNNLSPREFLGILQAVVDQHDADEVSIVTSKAMREKVRESQYADEILELAYDDTMLYFGALRSDRTFEESQLHVVIGAPHPGDDAVRQRMALLGYDDRIIQGGYAVRGEDRYKDNAETVLKNMVYSEVYQAARRAARDPDRDDTAFVYFYTRMFDTALVDADQPFTVDLFGSGEKRKGGTEAIITVLNHAEQPVRTTEVLKRVNGRLGDKSLSYNRVFEKLDDMASKEVIEKIPWKGRTKRWKLNTPPRHGTLIEETEIEGDR